MGSQPAEAFLMVQFGPGTFPGHILAAPSARSGGVVVGTMSWL